MFPVRKPGPIGGVSGGTSGEGGLGVVPHLKPLEAPGIQVHGGPGDNKDIARGKRRAPLSSSQTAVMIVAPSGFEGF